MSTKTYYFFRCKTTHDFFSRTIEKGTFVGKGGTMGLPFERAQLFVESTIEANKEMYFPGDEYWEVVSISFSENDLEPAR